MDRDSRVHSLAGRAVILLCLASWLLGAQESLFVKALPWVWDAVGGAVVSYAFAKGADGLHVYFSDTPEGQYNKGVKCLKGDGVTRDPKGYASYCTSCKPCMTFWKPSPFREPGPLGLAWWIGSGILV